jgi:hypothetical protein
MERNRRRYVDVAMMDAIVVIDEIMKKAPPAPSASGAFITPIPVEPARSPSTVSIIAGPELSRLTKVEVIA